MTRSRAQKQRKQQLKVVQGTTALMERTEPALDEPILLYEARGKRGATSALKSFSLAWDETEAMGIGSDMRRSGSGLLSEADRKETLYQAYLNSVWISACVDVIAKRITSGGMVIELTEKGTDNQDEYNTLHDFLHYINDDEDFLQLIRSIATDLLIYGEAYMEIVRKNGVPFSLHKIDCSTMTYKIDQHGGVIKYVQSMNHSNESIDFDPDDVIRWWLPDPKSSKKALSPIERILGPVDADAHMADWVRAFFRKGARPPFWIKFPGSKEEASRFVVWLRENYTGQANAHVPMVLYDGSELQEIGKGSVDMDFTKGREMMRQEILAGYQVPPAIVSQIESGNIGGGTGESQDKSFQYNACDPIRQIIFEKFNYRIVVKGFNITNWKVTSRYADFRSDDSVGVLQDRRIRNGSNTVNEVRAEMGKNAVDGGDEAVIVASRDIIPVARLESLTDEQAQQAGVAIQQSQAQLDMTKVQIDKAKNPPPPPPTIVQAPPEKKPVDDKAQQQEQHIRSLQYVTSQVNEALARTQEQLQIARTKNAPIPTQDEENSVFKQSFLSELQWLKENEEALAEHLKQEMLTIRSLIEMRELPPDIPPFDEKKVFDAVMQQIEQESNDAQETIQIDGSDDLPTSSDTESVFDSVQEHSNDIEEQEAQHFTGMMVALMLDPNTAKKLALPNGEPIDQMHVTLMYLGDSEDPELARNPAKNENDLTSITNIVKDVASQCQQAMSGTVGGLGRFTASGDSDGKDPIIALIDIPGLVELRMYLMDCLEINGFFVAKNHGYTPHCTLAYIDADAPMPIETISSLPLTFYGITLAIGDMYHYFPFGGDNNEQRPFADTETLPPTSEDSTGEQSTISDDDQGTTETITASSDSERTESTTGIDEVEPALDATTEATETIEVPPTTIAEAQPTPLETSLSTLFHSVYIRGTAAMESGGGKENYLLSEDDQRALAELLAHAYLDAKSKAYQRAQETAGKILKIRKPWKPLKRDKKEATNKAQEQAKSIVSTYQGELNKQFKDITEEAIGNNILKIIGKVKEWIQGFIPWKSKQIADHTVSTGDNDGTSQWIEDARGGADGDPNGVRVRVIPEESSSDYCKTYAGNMYSLEEFATLPVSFPAHPNCKHSLEVYTV